VTQLRLVLGLSEARVVVDNIWSSSATMVSRQPSKRQPYAFARGLAIKHGFLSQEINPRSKCIAISSQALRQRGACGAPSPQVFKLYLTSYLWSSKAAEVRLGQKGEGRNPLTYLSPKITRLSHLPLKADG